MLVKPNAAVMCFPRKYYPAPKRQHKCFICGFASEDSVEVQNHLNNSHPGWVNRAIKSIRGEYVKNETQKTVD